MMVGSSRGRGPAITVVVALLALAWVFPLFWAVLNSFRDYAYTSANGYFALGGWTLDNYSRLLLDSGFARSLLNSAIVCRTAVESASALEPGA